MNVTKWMPGVAWDCTITVAAEDSDTVAITLQFKDFAGNNLAEACSVKAFSATSAGAYAVNTMDTDYTASVGTIAITLSKGCYQIVSTATGAVTLSVGDTGANTEYLAIVLPNGKIVLSDVITLT